MICSKNIDDLHPSVKAKVALFIRRCEAELKLDKLQVTATYRDNEYQDSLYAQGRTKPGKIVTNARGGTSWHNYRCAVDVVPVQGGKLNWGSNPQEIKTWMEIGRIGKECGLEWAWDWPSFKEMAHFQYTGGLTMAQLAAGKVPV